MTPDQITPWAAAGESETLELKSTTGQRREAARTLCAMLNHRGGRVLFGVEPGGRIVGQQVSDHTIEDIAREIREIEPPVFPAIDRVVVNGGREVLVVSVATGHSQPYTHRGQAFRRVGTTNQALSREEKEHAVASRALKRSARQSCAILARLCAILRDLARVRRTSAFLAAGPDRPVATSAVRAWGSFGRVGPSVPDGS